MSDQQKTLEYRTRFKTSKRKLPKGIAPLFAVGEEISVQCACGWNCGVPIRFVSTQVIITCMDEYAIVCEYKDSPQTILIIDWGCLHKGNLNIDKEILERIKKVAA